MSFNNDRSPTRFNEAMARRHTPDMLGSPGYIPYQRSRCKATLIFYSPWDYHSHVVRPLAYQFDHNLVDECLRNGGSLTEAVAPRGKGRFSAPINSAIRMAGDGHAVDIEDLRHRWTFMLTEDIIQEGAGIAGSTKRRITTGFVAGDERGDPDPVHVASNTYNYGVLLVFMHSTVFQDTEYRRQGKSIFDRRVTSDVDLVGSSAKNYVDGVSALATPSELLRGTIIDRVGESMGYNYGPMALDANRRTSSVVKGMLRSPRHHLSSIMDGLDRAIETSYQYSDFATSNDYDLFDDGRNDFNSIVADNLQSSFANLPMTGLDVSVPMYFKDLMKAYRDDIDVGSVVVRPGESRYFDVADPTRTDAYTVTNSLISSIIPSLLTSCKLGSISFRYDSNPKEFGEDGIFEMTRVSGLIDMGPRELEASVCQFKELLIQQLTPLVLTTVGHFNLICASDLAGETVIDLYLYDYPDYDLGGALFETSNKLNGLINPLLVDDYELESNGANLANFVNMIGQARQVPTAHIEEKLTTPKNNIDVDNIRIGDYYGDDRSGSLGTLHSVL